MLKPAARAPQAMPATAEPTASVAVAVFIYQDEFGQSGTVSSRRRSASGPPRPQRADPFQTRNGKPDGAAAREPWQWAMEGGPTP